MHATHYYTQSNKQGGKDSNTWANTSGQKFMPYSSNASSMEAIANRLMQNKKNNPNGSVNQSLISTQGGLNDSTYENN